MIHGRYLRYTDFVRRRQTKLLDTWKVPQIHGRYLRYMEGTSDTWTSSEGGRPNLLIHGRYLRYMEGTSDTWKVPQIHGRYLRYIDFFRRWQTKLLDTWEVPQIHGLHQESVEALRNVLLSILVCRRPQNKKKKRKKKRKHYCATEHVCIISSQLKDNYQEGHALSSKDSRNLRNLDKYLLLCASLTAVLQSKMKSKQIVFFFNIPSSFPDM